MFFQLYLEGVSTKFFEVEVEKFLQQVANYYSMKKSQGEDLGCYTFVFPNKRAAMFMRKYLKEKYVATTFMPRMITITAFTQEFSTLPLGSNLELTFLLYQAYAKTLADKGRADQTKDFDSFLFWGQVLLNDFNDIDTYLVDEFQLFRNIKAEKEIASNYLTPEQIEVARILGEKYIEEADPEHFWRHVKHADEKENAASKFVNLWEMLHDIYLNYHSLLSQRGIAYSGMQSRDTYKHISEMALEDFRGQKFAFIGFYVLPTSRMLIFKRLRDLGIAQFFWDTSSPLFSLQGNKATELIAPLAKAYPPPQDFVLQPIETTDLADIEIISVPTNIGQTKVAARKMREWCYEDAQQGKNVLNQEISAIVLPNEKLLVPLLYSLPEDISRLNVAMRINFTTTPFASLITAILHTQQEARIIRGECCYYYKDVIGIISQPYISSMAPAEVQMLRERIVYEHLYNVPAKLICEICPTLSQIFAPVSDDIYNVKKYLDGMLNSLTQYVAAFTLTAEKSKASQPYELAILQAYETSINEIYALALNYGIAMKGRTFFNLLRKLLLTSQIQLNGDPVSGLQILGLQDARVLDFDNLIMLSLNERILPKKNFTPSLVPIPLRVAYGMPTPESEEITLAYQFYRLITRASRICLLYDSRTPDESTGEISRYLQQLKIMLPNKVRNSTVQIGMKPFTPRVISVEKDETVMKELAELRPPGKLNFSASALKTYIKCPLRFYLQNVKKMNNENFDPEYMDAASYGQIMHRVAEIFYSELRGNSEKGLIRPEDIKAKLADPKLFSHLTHMAMREMNHIYYRDKYNNLDELPGEGRVLAKVIATYIMRMLHCESEGKDFIFVSGEDQGGQKRHVWKVDDERVINFTMSIDRIDQLDANTLRFIDYKTGTEKVKSPNIENLFTDPECGGIFQLMLYCLVYGDLERQKSGRDLAIKPKLYVMSKINTDGLPDLKIGDNILEDYRVYRDEYREKLSELLDTIFDPELPFNQTNDADNCKFCPYISMCSRNQKSIVET